MLPLVQKVALFIRGFAVKYEDGHDVTQLKQLDHGVHVFKQRLVGPEPIHVDVGIHNNDLARQVVKCYSFDCSWTLTFDKLVQVFNAHVMGWYVMVRECDCVIVFFSETIQINFSLNLWSNNEVHTNNSVELGIVMRMLVPEDNAFISGSGGTGHRCLQWNSISMNPLKLDGMVRNCSICPFGLFL